MIKNYRRVPSHYRTRNYRTHNADKYNRYVINDRIQANSMRLIDDKGKQIAILSRQEAFNIAQEKQLDLVLITNQVEPPVVKLIEFNKFLYHEEKKLRAVNYRLNHKAEYRVHSQNFYERNKDKILAVGECGMDFHWDKEHHEEQKRNFEKIIKFVDKINKPIIIHSREAEAECVELLEKSKIKKVILHMFEGRKHLIMNKLFLPFTIS